MVVKAKDTVTIIDQTDIDHLAIWYRSQSATLSAPAAPTTATTSATPSGWSTSEPTFDSANPSASLALAVYTCQQTVWTNGACTWGAVSKSTSYEAAKAAYNEAIAAGSAAGAASEKADGAVASVTRYYAVADSKPSKPTTNPPGAGGDSSTITWDGDTTGLDYCVMEETDEGISAIYKVAEPIDATAEDFYGQTITYGSDEFNVTEILTADLVLSEEGVICIFIPQTQELGIPIVYLFPTDEIASMVGASSGGFYFFKRTSFDDGGSVKAENFVSELTLPSSGGGSEVNWSTVEPTGGMVELPVSGVWDGNDTFSVTAPIGLKIGETYIVNWDGVDYETVAFDATGMLEEGIPAVAMGNIEGAEDGMPFVVAELPAEVASELGFYGVVVPGPGYGETVFYIYGKGGGEGSLYYVDCTTYMDGSFSYSEVSKSMAKDAADAAQDAADAANAAVKSLVKDVDVMYAQGSSSTTAPTSGWSTTAPPWVDGKFIWQKTVTTYGDGTTSESAATCITGAAGTNGTNGRGVSSIVEQYYQSTSSSTQTGGSWETSVPPWVDGKYIWTRSVITYTDGNSTTTSPVCVTGAKGKDGADGVRGTGIYKITTAPSSYTTATGGFTPTYRIALSTVKTQSGATKILVGDQLRYSYYLYPVGYVDSSYVYLGARTSIRGSTGASGKMLYATSSTAAATAAKVATLDSGTLTLAAGSTVAVKFTYANTAASPTLNVGSTGAKAVYTNGVAYAYWEAGATVMFVYSGSYWYVASSPVYASTATVGNPAGGNVYIDADSVDIRKGTDVLAMFGASQARIGSESGRHAAVDTDGFAVKDGATKVFDVSYDDEYVWLKSGLRRAFAFTTAYNMSVFRVGGEDVSIEAASEYPLILRGKWGTYTYVTGHKVLYSNSSGTTGTVTLSESVGKFHFIDIFFTPTSGNASGHLRVWSPDGATADLQAILAGSNGWHAMYTARYAISGTTLTPSFNSRVEGTLNGTQYLGSNYLSITAVVGYA